MTAVKTERRVSNVTDRNAALRLNTSMLDSRASAHVVRNDSSEPRRRALYQLALEPDS